MPTVTTVRPRSPGVASSPRQRRTSMRPGRSGDPVQPAVGVGHPAVLDVEQVLAQPHGQWPGLPVADGEVTGARLDLADRGDDRGGAAGEGLGEDRKSTRLNSSHANISYAVFCLKKKNRAIVV